MYPTALLLLASACLLFTCDPLRAADGDAAAADAVRVVASPPTAPGNRSYVTNREPLAPSPLVRLPVGSITPDGYQRGCERSSTARVVILSPAAVSIVVTRLSLVAK